MGYALKLNRVDFSRVAVDTVTYIEEVPCTGISLDQSTLSFVSAEEEKTLVASPVPANTTDEVVWTSSNDNIATVDNGVVTIHGIGNATITATCGDFSASATIAQTSLKQAGSVSKISGYYPGDINADADGRVVAVLSISNQYTFGQVYSGTEDLAVFNGQDRNMECVRVPYGASKVKIATTDSTPVSISYSVKVDTQTLLTYNGKRYPKYLRSQTFVNTQTGWDVSYGEAVIFRPVGTQADTLDYIYFE